MCVCVCVVCTYIVCETFYQAFVVGDTQLPHDQHAHLLRHALKVLKYLCVCVCQCTRVHVRDAHVCRYTFLDVCVCLNVHMYRHCSQDIVQIFIM